LVLTHQALSQQQPPPLHFETPDDAKQAQEQEQGMRLSTVVSGEEANEQKVPTPKYTYPMQPASFYPPPYPQQQQQQQQQQQYQQQYQQHQQYQPHQQQHEHQQPPPDQAAANTAVNAAAKTEAEAAAAARNILRQEREASAAEAAELLSKLGAERQAMLDATAEYAAAAEELRAERQRRRDADSGGGGGGAGDAGGRDGREGERPVLNPRSGSTQTEADFKKKIETMELQITGKLKCKIKTFIKCYVSFNSIVGS